MVWAAGVDQPGNPALFFPLWNSISQGPSVVSFSAISSAALTLSSAASLSFLLSLCLCFHPAEHTSLPLLHLLHLCAQGSSEACSWLRPPLLWAKDLAGGQGSGSSLKKSRQIKDTGIAGGGAAQRQLTCRWRHGDSGRHHLEPGQVLTNEKHKFEIQAGITPRCYLLDRWGLARMYCSCLLVCVILCFKHVVEVPTHRLR